MTTKAVFSPDDKKWISMSVKKNKTQLKIYIFTGFCPDYTDGLAFAIASSEKDARKQIVKSNGIEPFCWGDLEIRPLNKRVARSVEGGG